MATFHTTMPDGTIAIFEATDLADAQRQKEAALQARAGQPAPGAEGGPSTIGDIATGASTGVIRGIAAVPGAPGDIGALTNAGLDAIWNYATGDDYHSGEGILPTSQKIRDVASEVTGVTLPEPVTGAGKFAERVGELVPGAVALGGPGAALAKGAYAAGKGVVTGGAVAAPLAEAATTAARGAVPAALRYAAAPAVTGEAAAQGAKAVGLPEGGQDIARTAGEVVGAVGGGLAGRNVPKGIRETPQIEEAAGKLYTASEAEGVQLTPRAVLSINKQIAEATTKEGFNKYTSRTTPKLVDALSGFVKMEDDKVAPTLREMDQMRSMLSAVTRTGNDNERRLASHALEAMDNALDSFGAGDIVGNKGADRAVGFLKQARAEWRTAEKNKIIDEVLRKAELNIRIPGDGPEKVVDQFRALARDKRTFRQFSEREQMAIMKVVNGGPIQQSLRLLARSLPKTPWGISTMAGPLAAVGYAVGGPMGAAALTGGAAATGAAGRVAVKKGIRRAVGNVRAETQGVRGLPPSSGAGGLSNIVLRNLPSDRPGEPLDRYVETPNPR